MPTLRLALVWLLLRSRIELLFQHAIVRLGLVGARFDFWSGVGVGFGGNVGTDVEKRLVGLLGILLLDSYPRVGYWSRNTDISHDKHAN
jgi:hypothetical protein